MSRSDGQPGSYQLAGRVSTDKRPRSDRPIRWREADSQDYPVVEGG
jgi:hypothetical protein